MGPRQLLFMTTDCCLLHLNEHAKSNFKLLNGTEFPQGLSVLTSSIHAFEQDRFGGRVEFYRSVPEMERTYSDDNIPRTPEDVRPTAPVTPIDLVAS